MIEDNGKGQQDSAHKGHLEMHPQRLGGPEGGEPGDRGLVGKAYERKSSPHDDVCCEGPLKNLEEEFPEIEGEDERDADGREGND